MTILLEVMIGVEGFKFRVGWVPEYFQSLG